MAPRSAAVLHFEQTGDIFDFPLTVTMQYADRKPADVDDPRHRQGRRDARCRSKAPSAASTSLMTTARWPKSSRTRIVESGLKR